MEITRTAATDTTTWTLAIDGDEIAWLSVWTANREICDAETRASHQGNGHARTLFEHANNEAPIFHTIPAHRTDEGHAFALAVGGDTVDDALVIESCYCDHCDA